MTLVVGVLNAQLCVHEKVELLNFFSVALSLLIVFILLKLYYHFFGGLCRSLITRGQMLKSLKGTDANKGTALEK